MRSRTSGCADPQVEAEPEAIGLDPSLNEPTKDRELKFLMHRLFTGLGTVHGQVPLDRSSSSGSIGTFAAVKATSVPVEQVNNDNTAFLPSSAPDVKAANLAEPLVGKESLAPITLS